MIMRYETQTLRDTVALMHAHVDMGVRYACRNQMDEALASTRARWIAAPWVDSPMEDTLRGEWACLM